MANLPSEKSAIDPIDADLIYGAHNANGVLNLRAYDLAQIRTLVQSGTADPAIKNVTYDPTTGEATFTRLDNTTFLVKIVQGWARARTIIESWAIDPDGVTTPKATDDELNTYNLSAKIAADLADGIPRADRVIVEIAYSDTDSANDVRVFLGGSLDITGQRVAVHDDISFLIPIGSSGIDHCRVDFHNEILSGLNEGGVLTMRDADGAKVDLEDVWEPTGYVRLTVESWTSP